jgi:two-component system, cell cycle response regulator
MLDNRKSHNALNGEDTLPSSSEAEVFSTQIISQHLPLPDKEDCANYQKDSKLKGSLVIIDGTPADVGNHVVVGDEVLIGREQGPFPLRDGRISRRHCILRYREGSYWIEDLGSTNGTQVNGRPVLESYKLSDGDQIFVGRTVMKFTLVDNTEANYLRQMERLVGTDALTGLVAKYRFDAALAEAIRIARMTGRPLSVLMMDMDGLKQVNDTHGHHFGANTISCVGKIIADTFRGRGEACRFGGDEFSAYLPGVDIQHAVAVGEQICEAVRTTPFPFKGIDIRVSISIGVTELLPEIATMEQLLHLADQALYRAKRAGRDRVSI